jgi:hypothetical protein
MKKLIENVKYYAFVAPVLAASGTQIDLAPSQGLPGQLRDLTVPGIISALVRLSLVIAAIVFFFILVVGGIRWILSGGDKANTEAARSQITSALVGLIIVFAAWAILELIRIFFGINILTTLEIPSAQ